MITVIGRMADLPQFGSRNDIDTWAKSGRIPVEGEPPVTWPENKAWLNTRIERGDAFGLATPETELSPTYVPGEPNGHFTFREVQYLRSRGIEPRFVKE